MEGHTHRYTIADDEAVMVLLDKALTTGSHQQRREKHLKALDEAFQAYKNSTTQVEVVGDLGLTTSARLLYRARTSSNRSKACRLVSRVFAWQHASSALVSSARIRCSWSGIADITPPCRIWEGARTAVGRPRPT